MAEITPLRAWRYNDQLSADISNYICPLFDVVSAQQREQLYTNPLNSIHLSVPKGPNAAQKAADTLKTWKEQRIIVPDLLPSIYVYYQYFHLPGTSKLFCRKGFIANIRAYDWADEVVLRHENTMPPAVAERVELLQTTQLNASPTHGLYSDPSFELDSIMDECIRQPIFEAEDYQGVREVVSVIHDFKAIKKFIDLLDDQQIILADGHHRFQGSIDYRKAQAAQNPHHHGKEGYNYHMMFFTNMEAQDLRILATHRLIQDLPDFDPQQVMSAIHPYFDIVEANNPLEINEVILGKQHCFGLVLPNQVFKISLKPDLALKNPWPFPDIIKNLDLTVLHYFIIERALGIMGKDQRYNPHIIFDRNFTDCIERVHQGSAQLAVITNELNMEEVKKVCFSGYTLPPKSTYFYPKVVCGFVFGTINDDEFNRSHFPSF